MPRTQQRNFLWIAGQDQIRSSSGSACLSVQVEGERRNSAALNGFYDWEDIRMARVSKRSWS